MFLSLTFENVLFITPNKNGLLNISLSMFLIKYYNFIIFSPKSNQKFKKIKSSNLITQISLSAGPVSNTLCGRAL